MAIENSAAADIRPLRAWLEAAGVRVRVVRAHGGDPVPESSMRSPVLSSSAVDRARSARRTGAAPRGFRAVQHLLREAVTERIPIIGVCLGAQLLTLALGG